MLLVSSPTLGSEEKAALTDVIDSGWITMGAQVRQFETAFSAMHGASDAVAVNSCTAALHLILVALGIRPGDEVLVPSLTFAASVNAIIYVGAKPVFVDIESLDHPIMSLADAEAKCTARTRAAIVVHYAGYVVDGEAWKSLAAKHDFWLVEDAAHAAGAEGVGRMGAATAFSFYGNKNMTTGEGGMVLAEDPDHLARMRLCRGHGLTSGTFERRNASVPSYDVVALGYNYRLDDMRAAIGLRQLARLPAWNARRRALTHLYFEALDQHAPMVGLPFRAIIDRSDVGSAHHIMPAVLPDGACRERVAAALNQAGVQTSNHYPPVHRLSYYRATFGEISLETTEAYARRQITLPLHPGMTDDDVWQVSRALGAVLN